MVTEVGNMNKFVKIILLLVALSLCLTGLIACDKCADGHTFNDDNVCSICGKKKCDVEGHDYVNGVCKLCDNWI